MSAPGQDNQVSEIAALREQVELLSKTVEQLRQSRSEAAPVQLVDMASERNRILFEKAQRAGQEMLEQRFKFLRDLATGKKGDKKFFCWIARQGKTARIVAAADDANAMQVYLQTVTGQKNPTIGTQQVCEPYNENDERQNSLLFPEQKTALAA